MAPDPSVGNPEVASVFAEYKDVHPDIGELLGGTVAGSIKDVPKALTEYSNQVDKAWTAAIEAAKGKGSSVDVSDFVFSNWDPMKNYTAEDYQALK
jgi:multiple sugar transport system substrate-binding protein